MADATGMQSSDSGGGEGCDTTDVNDRGNTRNNPFPSTSVSALDALAQIQAAADRVLEETALKYEQKVRMCSLTEKVLFVECMLY
jgi:hypothetical protein